MRDLYLSNETGQTLHFSLEGVPGSGELLIHLFDEWPIGADSPFTVKSGQYAKVPGDPVLQQLAQNGRLNYTLKAHIKSGIQFTMAVAERDGCGSPVLVFEPGFVN
jgi:hypothetical protein